MCTLQYLFLCEALERDDPSGLNRSGLLTLTLLLGVAFFAYRTKREKTGVSVRQLVESNS